MSQYQGRRREDADYGLGEHTFDADRLGMLDETELTDRLVRAFEAPGYVPPRLPAVATELLALSRNPDVKFEDLEALLERDAVLAGEVLALSRSAYYARSRPPGSMREALVLLGLDKLRDVVVEAAMNLRVFRCASYRACMDNLRTHCRATAHLARIVSRYTPIGEEQAFLCGLLHDVGIAGIMLVLGDTARGRKAPELDLLWPAIDRAHPRAGERMVQLWKLPAETATAVGAHHQVRVQGFDHPIAAAICIAESLAVEFGLGFVTGKDGAGVFSGGPIDTSDPSVIERARAALSLDDPAMRAIRLAAHDWTGAGNAAG